MACLGEVVKEPGTLDRTQNTYIMVDKLDTFGYWIFVEIFFGSAVV
jgi:hypothetical protein